MIDDVVTKRWCHFGTVRLIRSAFRKKNWYGDGDDNDICHQNYVVTWQHVLLALDSSFDLFLVSRALVDKDRNSYIFHHWSLWYLDRNSLGRLFQSYGIIRLPSTLVLTTQDHADVIKWKHFPRYWPFLRGIHRSPEFPAHRPVTRSFDVFFDLHPNKRLSGQEWCWWFETQLCPLWYHPNETCYFNLSRRHELHATSQCNEKSQKYKLFFYIFSKPYVYKCLIKSGTKHCTNAKITHHTCDDFGIGTSPGIIKWLLLHAEKNGLKIIVPILNIHPCSITTIKKEQRLRLWDNTVQRT